MNYRTPAVTCECVDAIKKHVAPGSYDLILVDNASGDDSVTRIREAHPGIRLIVSERNLGFGAGNNLGVAATTAPFVVLLNSDAMLEGDTPGRMVDFLEANPDVACLGPRVNMPDGIRQPKVCGHRPSPWRTVMQSTGLSRFSRRWSSFNGIDAEEISTRITRIGWVSGVCMAIRRAHYQAIDGFDPAFFMYCEDIDLCMRLQRFGHVVHVDDWPVVHLGGASSPSVDKRVRNAVWQQRNLLMILCKEYGRARTAATRIGMLPGHCLRIAVGLMQFGRDENYLLYSSCARLLDSFGLWRDLKT